MHSREVTSVRSLNPAETEHTTDELETVSEDIIQAACAELGLTDPTSIRLVTDGMREIANTYIIDLWIEPYWGTPKSQRAALRRLADALVSGLCRMCAVSPEYAIALRHEDPSLRNDLQSLFGETRDNMIALVNAIGEFDQNYEPRRGKPTNIPLETAVRDLIDLIEPLRQTAQGASIPARPVW